jgi:hypothetical protein
LWCMVRLAIICPAFCSLVGLFLFAQPTSRQLKHHPCLLAWEQATGLRLSQRMRSYSEEKSEENMRSSENRSTQFSFRSRSASITEKIMSPRLRVRQIPKAHELHGRIPLITALRHHGSRLTQVQQSRYFGEPSMRPSISREHWNVLLLLISYSEYPPRTKVISTRTLVFTSLSTLTSAL